MAAWEQLWDFIEVYTKLYPKTDIRLRTETCLVEETDVIWLSLNFDRPTAAGMAIETVGCCLDMQAMMPMSANQVVDYVESRFSPLYDKALERLKAIDSEIEPEGKSDGQED